MIVVDTSAMVEVLFRSHRGLLVEQRLRDSGGLAAPHLIDAETGQVIRRYVISGELRPQQGQALIRQYLAFPIQRFSHQRFLERAFTLRNQATVYDALYVVLAEVLNCPVVTCAAALGNLSGHQAAVEVISG